MNAEENKALVLSKAKDYAKLEILDIRDEEFSGRSIISGVLIKFNPRHWRIHIWSRGAGAGELVVNAEDGIEMLDRLIPAAFWDIQLDA